MKTKPADQLFCGVRKKVIQNANPQINEENLLHLYNFIKRRYNIHLKKDVLGKPQPWTNDPVLQEFRFTNIRREHDRESKWLIKNISTNPDLAYEDKLLNSILFRLYNKHQTSELIGMPFTSANMRTGILSNTDICSRRLSRMILIGYSSLVLLTLEA